MRVETGLVDCALMVLCGDGASQLASEIDAQLDGAALRRDVGGASGAWLREVSLRRQPFQRSTHSKLINLKSAVSNACP